MATASTMGRTLARRLGERGDRMLERMVVRIGIMTTS
jgi:hypothetical protein